MLDEDVRGYEFGQVYFGQGFEWFGKYEGCKLLWANDLNRPRRQRNMTGTVAGRIAMAGDGVFINRAARALLIDLADVNGALFVPMVGG